MLRHSEHPPIMKDPSWTRAAPFKETAHARTPSESIANNYTPSANSLKIRNLAKLQTPVRPPSRVPTQQACILALINIGNIITVVFGNNMNQGKISIPCLEVKKWNVHAYICILFDQIVI